MENKQCKIIPFPGCKFKMPEREVIQRAADPVKDKAVLEQIKAVILDNKRYARRNWLIFVVGINIGRRCGDLLKLRIGDVFDGQEVKSEVVHREEKTQKVISFWLSDPVKEAIREYLDSRSGFSLNDYLFPSQKGGHLLTASYWLILHEICKKLDLGFRLSTHSMRKTWAYHLYQTYKDVRFEGGYDIVDSLQLMLGHSSRLITLHYLGIDHQVMQSLYATNVL